MINDDFENQLFTLSKDEEKWDELFSLDNSTNEEWTDNSWEEFFNNETLEKFQELCNGKNDKINKQDKDFDNYSSFIELTKVEEPNQHLSLESDTNLKNLPNISIFINSSISTITEPILNRNYCLSNLSNGDSNSSLYTNIQREIANDTSSNSRLWEDEITNTISTYSLEKNIFSNIDFSRNISSLYDDELSSNSSCYGSSNSSFSSLTASPKSLTNSTSSNFTSLLDYGNDTSASCESSTYFFYCANSSPNSIASSQQSNYDIDDERIKKTKHHLKEKKYDIEDERIEKTKLHLKEKRKLHLPTRTTRSLHLWQFMLSLLENPDYNPTCITWENENLGVFRIVSGQSKIIAKLWGIKKSNPSMTFDKMSRALRWCREYGFLSNLPKDGGFPKKLCFRFGEKARNWCKN